MAMLNFPVTQTKSISHFSPTTQCLLIPSSPFEPSQAMREYTFKRLVLYLKESRR
jgi:hypothetical protein